MRKVPNDLSWEVYSQARRFVEAHLELMPLAPPYGGGLDPDMSDESYDYYVDQLEDSFNALGELMKYNYCSRCPETELLKEFVPDAASK